MATAQARRDYEEVSEQLRTDTPYFARNFLKILPKDHTRGMVLLEPNEAQLELDRRLEEQRLAGKPQRAIVLKARRVGISTWIQAKLIQRSVFVAHHKALVVAHDVPTGAELFGMGSEMHRCLPDDERLVIGGVERPLRPDIRSYKRTRFLHFGAPGHIGLNGDIWPNSEYFVDTASEFEAGRGTARHGMHWSEFAVWPQPEQKATALMTVMAEVPDSLLVIESTANGHNAFKSRWDDAVEGRSDYVAFFWPWWKQRLPNRELEYVLPFPNEAERKDFRVGNIDQSPYAEEEPALVDPGPIDIDTGEHVPLTLEQLNWRRWAIANYYAGEIEKFHQEFPATPEQAFLATGRKVFEPMLVAKARAQAEKTDPRVGEGGPISGGIVAKDRKMMPGRHGKIEAPANPLFKPARLLSITEDASWRFWLDYKPPEGSNPGKLLIPEDAFYVVGVDVSEGLPESEDENADPAFHAIQVIDHKTREQVAEYRSRVDPDLLAEHALLTAQLFNEAILVIEKTGPGLAVVNKVWHDFHYTRTYRRARHEMRDEAQTERLGWETNRSTKHLLISGGQELLREQTHGIRSRRLVSEMETYIRTSTGKMVPERGKFADLLMAWLFAQQVAHEKPLRRQKGEKRQAPEVMDRYSAYQP